jgi:hypothetical protein
MPHLNFKQIALVSAISSLFLVGCGGGGGGGDSGTGGSGGGGGSLVTSYFVDGPAKGISYVCSPSGLSGVTSSTGSFTCRAGETVTLSLTVGSSTLNLGSVAVPTVSGVSIPVTMLANGLQVAEILHALNHGSMDAIDVSGVSIPTSLAAQINAYIASGGTLPTGQNSDDQFLAYIQSQATSGTPFVNPVTGTAKTFQETIVLPHLQDTIVAISSMNPTLPILNNTTKLSGTILYTGSGTVQNSGCTNQSVNFSGGSILNVTVNGDIQTAGTYNATFSTTPFAVTMHISAGSCTIGTDTVPVPAISQTIPVPSLSYTSPVTVTTAFSGNNISVPNGAFPSGCSGGNSLSGVDVGRANPMITLTQAMTCSAPNSTFTITETVKLVGAW